MNDIKLDKGIFGPVTDKIAVDELIRCQDTAFKRFKDYMHKLGNKVEPVRDYNNGRHRVFKSDSHVYYCVYKREFFHSFGQYFPAFVSRFNMYDGEGESLNREFANLAIGILADEIVFIHPDGFYSIEPMTFKHFCEKFDLIRKVHREERYKQLGGAYDYMQEITYCYPKSLLMRWG